MCDALSDGSFDIAVPRHLIATILAEADGEGVLTVLPQLGCDAPEAGAMEEVGVRSPQQDPHRRLRPACIRLASLPGEASLCQSRRFSMRERPRRKASNRAASALSGARLVMP